MTTASASAWTISRMARHENGGSPAVSYSGGVTVWGAATRNQCRDERRTRLGERWDQLLRRPLDHLRRAVLWKRAEVLVESRARVRSYFVDEGLGVGLEGARAPVRALESHLSLRRPLRRLEFPERSGHLFGGEVGTAVAVLAEVEPVCVPGRQAHHAGPGSPDPDGRTRPLRRLRCADRVVDAVVLAVKGRALILPEPLRDLDPFAELIDAIAGRREVVSVGPVLILLPPGPDSDLEPTTGHVVDVRRHLRLPRGVPVLHGGHEDTESDRGRVPRESGKERPRLEAVAIGRPTWTAEEMVAYPERHEAGLLGALCEVADPRVRPPRRGRHDDSEFHSPSVSGTLLRAGAKRSAQAADRRARGPRTTGSESPSRSG